MCRKFDRHVRGKGHRMMGRSLHGCWKASAADHPGYLSAAAAAASASSLPLMLPLGAGAALLSSRRAK